MPTCNCPGQELVGSMTGFTGEGQGQRRITAVQNAYRDSGLLQSYYVLMGNAFRWECKGNCDIRTRYSISPGAQVTQDPNTGLFHATLDNTTLKVWVECVQRVDA